MQVRIPDRRKNPAEVIKILATDSQISYGIAAVFFDRITKGKQPISESELTPLNASRFHILAVMKQNHLSRAPKKMIGKREKRNVSLFCTYHRDIGHKMERCNDQKNMRSKI